MGGNVCPQCGAPVEPGARECKFCGEKLVQQQVNQQYNPQMNQQYNPQMNQQYNQQYNPQMNQQFGQQQMNQPYNQMQPRTVYVQQPVYMTAINPAWPIKSKVAAGILGIFLGGLGIHKFYLGKIGMGLLYLIFCWTGIPPIVGFIEGVLYLCSNDENFQLKHHVRIG